MDHNYDKYLNANAIEHVICKAQNRLTNVASLEQIVVTRIVCAKRLAYHCSRFVGDHEPSVALYMNCSFIKCPLTVCPLACVLCILLLIFCGIFGRFAPSVK